MRVLPKLMAVWFVLAIGLIGVRSEVVERCTGKRDCKACTDCRACQFCAIRGGLCGACCGKEKAPDVAEVRCVRVVDGDTIVVRQDKRDVTVRLIGVDTPETKDPRKPIQKFGKEASEFTRSMVEGKVVRLEFGDTGKADRYGRTLAYVFRGDVLVNKEIIRLGYGHAYVKYPFDANRMDEFRAAEREARENKRGLWSDDDG